VEFYIPQLVTFLLYGAYWSSASLQEFLLVKSARSLQFAHRLFWFLGASCLDRSSGISSDGRRQVNHAHHGKPPPHDHDGLHTHALHHHVVLPRRGLMARCRATKLTDVSSAARACAWCRWTR
jgi:hypothetical protein